MLILRTLVLDDITFGVLHFTYAGFTWPGITMSGRSLTLFSKFSKCVIFAFPSMDYPEAVPPVRDLNFSIGILLLIVMEAPTT